jgi:16S rRNA A1518/A1519 N6-dimethyltransferase RsmA/KsgA/DIM1 with predicted DNA glycosylase/AP lyase activity
MTNQILYDQHFLIDEEVVTELIVAADMTGKDKIIEIGAGNGIITQRLAKLGNEVIAFEIDNKMKERLNEIAEKCPNLKVKYTDALDSSWNTYDKIIANIPFSIAEPLLYKAIKEDIKTMVLIVSDGFKKNIFSQETKIGILTNLFFDILIIQPIKKESFEPEPKTNCAIVKFVTREPKSNTEKILRNTIIGEGKTKNALRRAFVLSGKTKNEARDIIATFDINSNSLDTNVKKLTWRFFARLKEELDKWNDQK